MLFDVSSAELKPALVELLKRLAVHLSRLRNYIQIAGHTDSRPFPETSTITNWELSTARANAARRVLEASGLWPGQVNRVVGYADSPPLVPENPLADENRRISILAQRTEPPPPPADGTDGEQPQASSPDPAPPA
jgi:chemotaxis protein MotB